MTISNSGVLYLGIAISVIIAVFAAFLFATQIRRLGEKRRGDDKRS
jgi:Na+/proline symporter